MRTFFVEIQKRTDELRWSRELLGKTKSVDRRLVWTLVWRGEDTDQQKEDLESKAKDMSESAEVGIHKTCSRSGKLTSLV